MEKSDVAARLEETLQTLAAQRYALEQQEIRQAIEHNLNEIKDMLLRVFMEREREKLPVPQWTHYLTTLLLDVKGFSILGEDARRRSMSQLRGLARPLLDESDAQYVNTWGDAIIACFEKPTAGLQCACELLNVLCTAGIVTRIGMSQGKTLVHHNPLIGRTDIQGDSVNFAARLEPMAEPGEVLISEELRYHPEIEQDRFVFTPQQRKLLKDVNGRKKGNFISCYTVTLAEETKKSA